MSQYLVYYLHSPQWVNSQKTKQNMKNEKKCTGSCSDSCGGCKKPQDDQQGHIAHKAICEMASAKAKAAADAAEHEKCVASKADEFIADCKSAGKDPLEVVEYIAKRENISITFPAPTDPAKHETYDLLRAVVAKVVKGLIEDAAADIAESTDFDTGAISRLIVRALRSEECGHDADGDCDEEVEEEEDESEEEPRVRVVPMKVRRYDFVF